MSDHFGKISIQQPASPVPPPRRPPRKQRPSSQRVPKATKPRSSRKSLIWLLVFVLFLTLYSVAGFVGVPYYITTVLPKTIYEKTGFVFQVGAVNFNPLTFVFSAENSQIQPPNSNLPDFLKIKNLRAKLAPISLLRNDLVCSSFTIDGFEARITREADGSYVFSSLFLPDEQDNMAEMMDFSDLPFQFSLNNISVSNSKIIFSDLPLKKTHRVEDIRLALPTFSNFPFQAGNYIQPHFSATINGSPLELTGKASVGERGDNKHDTNLSCDIHSLNLPHYFEYLPFELPYEFTEGKADGRIGLTFSPKNEKGKKLAITFDLKVNDTALGTHNNSLKIVAPAANIIGTLYPVSKYIHLQTVSIRDPVISSNGESFGNNLRDIFNSDNRTSPASVHPAATIIDIDLVVVDGGVLQLFNRGGSGKPHISWNSIQFSLKNYTTATDAGKVKKRGSFRLTGDQNGASSTFSWQGELTAPKILSGSLSINNIQTSTLFQTFGIMPTVTSIGLADLKGKLSLDLTKSTPPSPLYFLKDTTISVQNFTLFDKKSTILTTPILTISGFSTAEGQTDFGDISIDNGTLRLTRGRLPKSFALFSENNHTIQSINFIGTATLMADRENGSKLHFSKFSLKANELNLAETSKNNLSITGKTENDGDLKAEGNISLSPFNGTLKTIFTQLQASSIFSLFTSASVLADMKGFIGGKGNLTFPKIGFVGELNLDKVSVNSQKKSVVSWETSIFQGLNFSTKPFHLGIVSAEIESPLFSWEITSHDNSPMENFSHFLQKHFPVIHKQNQTKNTITISPFDIQEILFKNGQIQVVEKRMTPVWQGSVTQLAGKITEIHSAETSVKSQFQLSGKLDDSLFTAEGQSDFFSKDKNGSYSFNLTNFPIADFHEQLAPLLDIDTSKGTFIVRQNSQWEDNHLSSSGTVLLTGIEPELEDSESALPLALLTDQEKSFNLDFSFTRQEPTSRSMLFDDMVTLFNKLIIKSSVSPLLLAAGDFTDLIDNEFAEFKPGETAMSRKGNETLARYSALLASTPNIGLSITGHYDPTIDAAAMKTKLETTESERVTAINRERYKIWKEQKKAYTKNFEMEREKILKEGKIAEQDIPPKILQEFVPTQPQQITVNNATLKDLADHRASIVYQYFTTQPGLKPGRITIVESKQPLQTTEDHSPRVMIRVTTSRQP